MNLFDETVEILHAYGKTLEDVLWVGGSAFEIINWQAAFHVEYYAGYGAQEVANDLVVVGADFWLERHEYDGSEGWSYQTMPERPTERREMAKVAGGMWDSVERLNNGN